MSFAECGGGTRTYNVMNTIFVIDCCLDMGRHDPNNQRLKICSNIVNGIMSKDRAAIITYSEFGTKGRTGLTDKNSAPGILSAYINDSEYKSNLIPAFEDALYTANSSTADMNRIIILTAKFLYNLPKNLTAHLLNNLCAVLP